MGLSPSRIKNSLHADWYFHADLLFQQSAWKMGRRMMLATSLRSFRGIEQLEVGSQTGDQMGRAQAQRRFACSPARQSRQTWRRIESETLNGGQQQHGIRSDMKSRLMGHC